MLIYTEPIGLQGHIQIPFFFGRDELLSPPCEVRCLYICYLVLKPFSQTATRSKFNKYQDKHLIILNIASKYLISSEKETIKQRSWALFVDDSECFHYLKRKHQTSNLSGFLKDDLELAYHSIGSGGTLTLTLRKH